VCDRLPLGVREGAEADGDVEPSAPPGVTLDLADGLPVLEAAEEGETGEADMEGLPVEDSVFCDLVEHWLLEAEPVMETLSVGEREMLTVTLCVSDSEAQGLALGDALGTELGLGQGEAVAEAFTLRLALERREVEGVLVRSVDPEAATLTEGDLLAERVKLLVVLGEVVCEAHGLALCDTLKLWLVLGQSEAEGVPVRATDPEATLAEGERLGERV
jgi:hypothetical protein